MSDLVAFLDSLVSDRVEILVAVLVILVVTFLIFGVTSLVSADPVARRLGDGSATGTSRRRAEPAESLRAAPGNPLLDRLFGRSAEIGYGSEGSPSGLRLRLIHAGYMQPAAVTMYYAARFFLAAGLPLGFAVFAQLFLRGLPFDRLLLVAGLLGLVGLYLPMLWIGLRAGRRQTAAREGFPDALDLLLVCVEAGLSLDAAMNRVAMEIGAAHPILGEQFTLVSLELRAGRSREVALRNLALRLGIDEAASLATLLIQSEQLGASIAQTLRVHSDDIRQKRMIAAEEKANMLPVKLSFPLVLFILPSIFVAVLTPAIIAIMRTFGTVAQ